MTIDALIERLTEAGPRLTEDVLAVMYQNPFWHERFGERATTHGRNDGMFHVSYVAQALAANDPGVIQKYARWLQQVLTSRGMCTRHLAYNFDLLAVGIANEGWADDMRAIDMLAAASEALHYPSGAASELQDHADAIFAATASQLDRSHIPDLLSYLADSLALGTPKTFVDHVVWLAGFFDRRSIPRAHLVDTLTALDAAITAQLPSVAPITSATLELARGALDV